ncbi:hypothetical protein [Puerhibacterium puerhi]|uniref:hypothetical protein n=1 Tax=Puerhibacterium puerhi TaxID=2692623 RepID=UPI001357626C|nr:hypothetical protein [Puerhibacterium puerhi]
MSEEIAGKLHFKGDLRERQFGIAGPATNGAMFEAVMTEYDEDRDITTVFYREF